MLLTVSIRGRQDRYPKDKRRIQSDNAHGNPANHPHQTYLSENAKKNQFSMRMRSEMRGRFSTTRPVRASGTAFSRSLSTESRVVHGCRTGEMSSLMTLALML